MEASTNEDAVLLSTDQSRASTLCQLHVIPHDDSVGRKNNFIQTDILLDEYKNFSEILKQCVKSTQQLTTNLGR